MLKPVNEVIEAVKKYRYILAIWTDSANFASVLKDPEKLLEVRAFDESGEFYAYRSTVDADFNCREIINDDKYADGKYDEEQYLDIDTTKPYLCTASGGRYSLPDGVTADKLKVRYYYKYDDDGVARKFDWRLVGFKNSEGGKNDGK